MGTLSIRKGKKKPSYWKTTMPRQEESRKTISEKQPAYKRLWLRMDEVTEHRLAAEELLIRSLKRKRLQLRIPDLSYYCV